MNKAEEFWQSKNGGKDSKTATENGELITPIYAVKLLHQYAQQKKAELLEDIIPAQKFFHALPPIAKDDYYQFIENQ